MLHMPTFSSFIRSKDAFDPNTTQGNIKSRFSNYAPHFVLHKQVLPLRAYKWTKEIYYNGQRWIESTSRSNQLSKINTFTTKRFRKSNTNNNMMKAWLSKYIFSVSKL